MEVVQAEPRAQLPALLVECVGLSRLSPHPLEGEPVLSQTDGGLGFGCSVPKAVTSHWRGWMAV